MHWLRKRSPFIIISSILGLIMTLFLVIPVIWSLTSGGNITATLADERTINAISTSFLSASIATMLVFCLGIPLAYIFARYEFHGKKIVDSFIDLPVLIPHNAAGIALLSVLSPISPIGRVLESFGITAIDSIFGIVIAMTFVSAPFMIRNAQEAFSSIDPAMERVARSLGATNSKVFVYVTLPLALRGILTGCLLTWTRSISEFGAVIMLAYYPKTAAVQLYDVFISEGLKAALPINALLILLAILILFVFKLITAKSTKPVF
ncbi:MAG: molybdate/tungstate transport system permease protein [Thermoproteota archaeon]|nr:molybdate/tungstate transport system permease protein [Thermoproteota archaeon]